jgi:hypothetical protein
LHENPKVTDEKWLQLTHTVTCNYECLLKACALRQEKLSFCHRNGAARSPRTGDPRRFDLGKLVLGLPEPIWPVLDLSRQERIAPAPHLHPLAQMNPLARSHCRLYADVEIPASLQIEFFRNLYSPYSFC